MTLIYNIRTLHYVVIYQFQAWPLPQDILHGTRPLPDGLVARIRRSHRRGPGSIPGQGSFLLSCFTPESL